MECLSNAGNNQKAIAAVQAVGAPPTWALSNHDSPRVVTRLGGCETGLARARALAMVAHAFATDANTLDWVAICAGLAGAFGSGLAYTIVRKLAVTEHPSVIVLYFPMVCLPAATLIGWNYFIWPTWDLWLVLLGVGVFTQVGQIGLTKAMQTDSASRATSLSYVQIIFAALLGLVLFSEIPDIGTIVGGCLIMMGALANMLLHRRDSKS